MRTILRFGFLLAGLALVGPATLRPATARAAQPEGDPLDWTHWRGPEMNGISREKNLPDRWSPDGENVLWKREDLGTRSTPIAMNGRLYFLARNNPASLQEGEKVVCLDAATGETIWENKFNVYLSDVPDTRVGWSSVVGDPETGNVYALGVTPYLACIDGETGETIWDRSINEEFGGLSTYGGRTNFPIVFEDLLIVGSVTIGWGEKSKPAHRYMAFDKRTGGLVWYESTAPFPNDTTYSSPVISVINGQPMMVLGAGNGNVYAVQPRTGKVLWSYKASARGINTTPLVVGGRVYCGHAEENVDNIKMGALFCLDATKKGDITETGEVWRNLEWAISRSTPLHVDGRIYAVEDNGTMQIVDAETGERIGEMKLRGLGRSSPIYADGKIYVCTETGVWWTLKPTEKGVEPVYRARLDLGDVAGSPIVSHGRMYIPAGRGMYCVGNPDAKAEAEPRPTAPEEAPVSTDRAPAHLQVVPAEVVLEPGQTLKYQTRVYNSRGQYLGTPEQVGLQVSYSIDGEGAIDASGQYTAPRPDANGYPARAIVTARAGELTGTARLRMFPEFPWSFDFSKGVVPEPWVGMRYRHVALDFDLIRKLEEQNPLAAQLYIYFTTSYVNGETDVAKYDNSTPAQNWTEFLRFLELLDTVNGLEQAKEALEPALALLKQEGVIGQWTWTQLDGRGPQLTVPKGPRQIDGNAVMCKISTIPLGTRSQGWIGLPESSDYTIQADVYSETKQNKLPDIGLTAQRYRLEMRGPYQDLKLASWIAHDQKYKTAPFAWEPDKWYVMKLRCVNQERDGKPVVLVQGKVWPKGEQEPSQWGIEWIDEPSNLQGSPGFFGNAKDAEVYYDNVKVYDNKPSES